MPTIGLVVEGQYDEAALKELMQKCSPTTVDVIGRPCGSVSQLMKRFPGFLEEFRYRTDIEKALVIRDAGNKDPLEMLKLMEDKISGRTYPFLVKRLVIVKELEAWLLADESGVSAVTGKATPIIQAPEKLGDPKERLKATLSDARISYTAEVARKIAASANVDTIERRCPSFRLFRQAVLDC
jgi:hypothetical protein